MHVCGDCFGGGSFSSFFVHVTMWWAKVVKCINTCLTIFVIAYASASFAIEPAPIGQLYDCSGNGQLSYHIEPFQLSDVNKQNMIIKKIADAMDKAIARYNCYTDLSLHIKVSYDSKLPTAKGRYFPARIWFGRLDMIHEITAMHEIAHAFGVGTDPLWNSLVENGKFMGSHASFQFEKIAGKHVDLNADRGHFWPYGLNQANEVKSERDLLYHCRMVAAIKRDMQELNVW